MLNLDVNIYCEYKISYLYFTFKKIHFIHEVPTNAKKKEKKTLEHLEATVFLLNEDGFSSLTIYRANVDSYVYINDYVTVGYSDKG